MSITVPEDSLISAVELDTIPAIPPGYVLISKHALNNTLVAAETLAYLKKEFPTVADLRDLYKEGYRIAIKMDTVQENRNANSEKIILLTDENYKLMKKRLYKNKLQELWDHGKVPISFFIGAVLGAKITSDFLR